ncbi:MAG: hypothetical protein J0L58_18320 [Burkholderiales bacterium]|nr:hypothetical protein [Burkholderiales bacterium]
MTSHSAPPRYIGFYSYKGGVGRSMAMAHTAAALARQGRRVLMIDLDLEAPGQHCTGPFHNQYEQGTARSSGFVGFAADFKPEQAPALESYLLRADPVELGMKPEAAGEVRLLPAGNLLDHTHYRQQLDRFSWDEALQDGLLLLLHLKDECQRIGFDDVLIDARTGDADPFYVVSLELADVLVAVCGFNRQNLLGTQSQLLLLSQYPAARQPRRVVLVGSPTPANFNRTRWETHVRSKAPHLRPFDLELPYHHFLAVAEDLLTDPKDDYVKAIDQLVERIAAQDPPVPVVLPSMVNPFDLIRSDYAKSQELLQTYVDPGERVTRSLDAFMPVMVYGNRGTGKTTLAKHYSVESAADGLGREPQSTDLPVQVGLYLRFDIDLLNAFNTRDEHLRDRFDRLFASFFDVLVLRKALSALDRFGGLSAWCVPEVLFAKLLREFGEELPAKPVQLTEFKHYLEGYFSAIRRHLNNPAQQAVPMLLQGNILMKLLVEELQARPGCPFGERWFAVLIDEVEHFQDYQQRVLNARIKQIKAQDRVTYRYFLRHEGLRTSLIPSVDSQPLQESHDFRRVVLDEGVDRKNFTEHVSQVALRRLQLHKQLGPLPLSTEGLNLDDLFETLSPEDEAAQVVKGNRRDEVRKQVEKAHPNLPNAFWDWFTREPAVLRKVVALFLLNQGKGAGEVVREFSDWSPKARDWYHNYHRAALHWLCRRYKKDKVYAGLNTLVLLSGNNVRYFLEYCRAIVDRWIASSEGEDQPKALSLPIPAAIQSAAIRERAQFHFDDLRGRPRHAGEMLTFVKRLGGLFEVMHNSDRQSQFEVNHFSIRNHDRDRQRELETLLRECRMENVLLRQPGNKQKALTDDRLDDWILHPCFAPLFNISPRRKKKLDGLTTADVLLLFKGSDQEYKALSSQVGKPESSASVDETNLALFEDE